MRKKIKVQLLNLNTKENLAFCCPCIVNKNTITFTNDNIKYKIEKKEKIVYILRENNEFLHTMKFSNDKTNESDYLLKESNLNLTLNIKTQNLIQNENYIYIKYKIEESNNIFEYILEMSDINEYKKRSSRNTKK